MINELEVRRVGNIKQLDRLRGELDSVIASHRSNGRSQKRKTDKPDARSGTANEAGTVATGGA